MIAARTIVPRSRENSGRAKVYCAVREIETTRWRDRYSNATMESTNGAAERYAVTDPYGASTACTTPTVMPPAIVTQSDRRRPISAAASDEITRKVSAA